MSDETVEQQDPTIPDDLNIQLIGFEEALANEVGQVILTAVREYSRFIPLESLDGITVAADYKQALSNIDRGFPCRPGAAQPTEEENIGYGTGMALPVLREKEWKTHVVFGPQLVGMYLDKDEYGLISVLNLIAHELGHVVDHHHKCRAFPGLLASRKEEIISDSLQGFLWELSHHIWDEYFANRTCSYLTKSGKCENDLFIDVCGSYKGNIKKHRIRYHRKEITLFEFLEVVKKQIYLALLATGYLLGLNDGRDENPSVAANATELLYSPKGKELVAFHEPLLKIWDKCPDWETYDEFLVLNGPTLDLLHSLELFPSAMKDGSIYLDVPVRL